MLQEGYFFISELKCKNQQQLFLNKKSRCSDDSHSSARLKWIIWVIHTSHTKHAVSDFFNVCKCHTTFKLHWQESLKKRLCSLWFWDTCDLETQPRSSNLYKLVEPKQGYSVHSLKNLAWTMSMKKLTMKSLSNQETCQLSSLNMCRSKKIKVYSWPA